VLHISDEVKKARLQLPRSMITSVVLNAFMQFIFMITVLFTIGDVNVVSSDPLPIIQVYYQATASRPATNLFVSMLGIIFTFSFFNIFASVSRLLWAFSRDNGLPFSTTFAQVHPTLKLPLNSLILLGACLCLLALINIGSSTAFNAFISLPALGLYISYFFPIFFLFWRRLSSSHPVPIPWGPFKLGAVGPFVNLGAMCYIAFVVIWMPFPAFLPVDSVNMNYSGPIVGAVILGALLDWAISGRTRFQVPVARHAQEFD
jgi:choline transport protein